MQGALQSLKRFNLFFIKSNSSLGVLFKRLAPYHPEHSVRFSFSNFGNNSLEFFGNFPPDSIPTKPALLVSLRHCSKVVSPPSSGMSSLLQAIGDIPNFIDIIF